MSIEVECSLRDVPASTTSSVEALRTLRLLEEHHRKLSELLRLSPDPGAQPTFPTDGNDEKPAQSEKYEASEEHVSAGETAVKSSQAPGVARQRRLASREMSSSIASNLASARGIRSSKFRGQPLAPSVSKDQAPGNVDHSTRNDAQKTKIHTLLEQRTDKPTWVPPTSASSSIDQS